MATNAPTRVKKLYNDLDDIVPESLAGLAEAHPDIVRIDPDQNLVLRAGGPKRGKVALISGGGSGHEPLHGGFVGTGMLDAAAAGHVFTSPVPDQMEAATRAVDGGAGVLHIVKNYTGDVLNFQLAAELVAGEIEVSTVVTNDDVAVQDSLYTAGRRGVGVTVLLEKIAGAHAEAGGSLADVTATAVKVNAQGRSMGLALTSCVVPAAEIHHGHAALVVLVESLGIVLLRRLHALLGDANVHFGAVGKFFAGAGIFELRVEVFSEIGIKLSDQIKFLFELLQQPLPLRNLFFGCVAVWIKSVGLFEIINPQVKIIFFALDPV
jgi:hypothetical protein